MGKESCIEHPKNKPFIIIKQSYVDLFGGDHAFAALMYSFEYFTNSELEHLQETGRQDDDPWINAPMMRIHYQTTGMYSERSIRPRIAVLGRLGLIKIDKPGRGELNRYLMDVDAVNAAIRSGKSYRAEELKLPEGKNAAEKNQAPAEPSTASSAAASAAILPSSPIVYKKEEEKKEEPPSPPTPSEPLPHENPEAQAEPSREGFSAVTGDAVLLYLRSGPGSYTPKQREVVLGLDYSAISTVAAGAALARDAIAGGHHRQPSRPVRTPERKTPMRRGLSRFTPEHAAALKNASPAWTEDEGFTRFREAYDPEAEMIPADWGKAYVEWLTLTEGERASAVAETPNYLKCADGFVMGAARFLREKEFTRKHRPKVSRKKLDPGEEYLRKHREAEEAAEKEWADL